MWLQGRLYPDHKSIAVFRLPADASRCGHCGRSRTGAVGASLRVDPLDRSAFRYDQDNGCFVCREGKTLKRMQISRKDRAVYYGAQAADCSACPRKPECIQSARRMISRHLPDNALQRMDQRATPALMRLRRSVVEHPFGTLKYRIFGHPRLLLRGLSGARTEIALPILAYNLKRMVNLLGAAKMVQTLA